MNPSLEKSHRVERMYPVMEVIKVLIVGEKSDACERIREMLDEREDFSVIDVCSNAQAARALVEEASLDLVFLCVDAFDESGVDLLGDGDHPAMIVVADSEKHARKLFNARAVDCLLEPFSDERFEWALSQARAHILHSVNLRMLEMLRSSNGEVGGDGYTVPSYLERLAVPLKDSIKVYKVEDIDYFEGAGVYVKVHVGEEEHLIRETLATLEQRLDPSQFLRIHRSTIVNMDRVEELRPYYHGDYMVYLSTGDELKLSRSRRENLETALGWL